MLTKQSRLRTKCNFGNTQLFQETKFEFFTYTKSLKENTVLGETGLQGHKDPNTLKNYHHRPSRRQLS